MTPFKPTLGIRETLRNIIGYTSANAAIYWDFFKVYIPYLFILPAIGLALTVGGGLYETEHKLSGMTLMQIPQAYIMFCLALNWYRLMILGTVGLKPVNPLAPSRQDMGYIGTVVGFMAVILITSLILAVISGALKAAIGTAAGVIFFCVCFLALTFICLRLTFFFPAKAVSAGFTLRQAYILSKGYVLRCVVTQLILLAPCYMLILLAAAILSLLKYIFVGLPPEGTIPTTGQFVADYFITVFSGCVMTPVILLLTMASITNYYLYAAQNGPRTGKRQGS